MGLLSRAGRAMGAFGDEFAQGIRWNAPVGNAVIGGGMGALGGAAMDQENPLRGAAIGAGIGAAGLGGAQVARALGRGASGAMGEWGAAQRIAQHLSRMAQREGPERVQAELQRLRMQEPDLAEEVVTLLQRGG